MPLNPFPKDCPHRKNKHGFSTKMSVKAHPRLILRRHRASPIYKKIESYRTSSERSNSNCKPRGIKYPTGQGIHTFFSQFYSPFREKIPRSRRNLLTKPALSWKTYEKDRILKLPSGYLKFSLFHRRTFWFLILENRFPIYTRVLMK